MEDWLASPIVPSIEPLLTYIVEDRSTLQEKRKIARIILTTAPTDISVSPGDMVGVFVKMDFENRVK